MKTATNIKKDYESLWQSTFRESQAWNQWFFDNVVKESDIKLLFNENATPVSGLLMRGYDFKFYNENLPLTYICGVATYRRYRGQGFMSQLMRDSLRAAYSRGDVFASVIPAERRLYFYYERFGFATVVYNEMERYTSLHSFPVGEGLSVENADFASFHELEAKLPVTVLHSEEDFKNLLSDIEMDGGVTLQIKDENSTPLSLAFAVTSPSGEIHVKNLLGTYQPALDRALYEVKMSLGSEHAMLVWRPAGNRGRIDSLSSLRPKAMLRIVNVEKVLEAISRQYPGVNQQISVHDKIIPENNAIFLVSKGMVKRVDKTSEEDRKLTLDVSVDVLTKILFSDEAVGHIFGIPSSRPNISLMLD